MGTRRSEAPIARGASLIATPLLAGEAAVHIQQFATLFDGVQWIGPLFIANAVACLMVIAGLSRDRTWAVSPSPA